MYIGEEAESDDDSFSGQRLAEIEIELGRREREREREREKERVLFLFLEEYFDGGREFSRRVAANRTFVFRIPGNLPLSFRGTEEERTEGSEGRVARSHSRVAHAPPKIWSWRASTSAVTRRSDEKEKAGEKQKKREVNAAEEDKWTENGARERLG